MWPSKDNLLYAANKLLKFLIVALAVFAGMQLSSSSANFSELVNKINRYHKDPLRFLNECTVVCQKGSKSPSVVFPQKNDFKCDPGRETCPTGRSSQEPDVTPAPFVVLDYDHAENPELDRKKKF